MTLCILYTHKIYRNSKLYARFAHMNGLWKTLRYICVYGNTTVFTITFIYTYMQTLFIFIFLFIYLRCIYKIHKLNLKNTTVHNVYFLINIQNTTTSTST